MGHAIWCLVKARIVVIDNDIITCMFCDCARPRISGSRPIQGYVEGYVHVYIHVLADGNWLHGMNPGK